MAFEIFVSHASQDVKRAEALVDALEAKFEGCCWISSRNLAPGEVWAAVASDALNKCRMLIVVVSEHSSLSEYVPREVEWASGKVTVVPFFIKELEPTGALQFFLKGLQRVNEFSLGPRVANGMVLKIAEKVLGGRVRDGQGLGGGDVDVRDPRLLTKRTRVPSKTPFALGGTRLTRLIKATLLLGALGLAISSILWIVNRSSSKELAGVNFEVRQRSNDSDWRFRLTTDSLHFFEGGTEVPPLTNRLYTKTFASPVTRYIFIEVQLYHGPLEQKISIPLVCSLFRGDEIMSDLDLEGAVEPGTTRWAAVGGLGNATPGQWRPGKYRVECRHGTQIIARSWFEVLE